MEQRGGEDRSCSWEPGAAGKAGFLEEVAFEVGLEE